jgi:hypothetical protein
VSLAGTIRLDSAGTFRHTAAHLLPERSGTIRKGATMRMSRKLVVSLVAVIAVAATSAAFASIPDSNGVIHTCFSQSQGTWRPIDPDAGQKCKSGDKQLDVNQKGVKGDIGPQGPAGPAGKDGVSGYESAANNTSSNSDDDKTVVAQCSPGKKVVGGGGSVTGDLAGAPAPPEVAIYYTALGSSGSWEVKAHEIVPTDADWLLVASAICVTAS